MLFTAINIEIATFDVVLTATERFINAKTIYEMAHRNELTQYHSKNVCALRVILKKPSAKFFYQNCCLLVYQP